MRAYILIPLCLGALSGCGKSATVTALTPTPSSQVSSAVVSDVLPTEGPPGGGASSGEGAQYASVSSSDLPSRDEIGTQVSDQVTADDLGVSIYPAAETLHSEKNVTTLPDGRSRGFATVSLMSNDDFDTIVDFYKDQLPGHQSSVSVEDSAVTLSPPEGEDGVLAVFQHSEGQTCIVLNRLFEE
jgi:hypothetical protein